MIKAKKCYDIDYMFIDKKLKPIENEEAMNNLLVIMDMNNGFAKKGALYSPRTEKLIEPIAAFCSKAKSEGWRILALSDCHDSSDPEMKSFPTHCMKGTKESLVVDEIKPFCDVILPKFTTGSFFEIQAAKARKPFLNLNQYDEIHVTGCCTDLCVFNFAVMAQKYFEFEFHNGKIQHMPRIIVHKDLVDTYDGDTHPADEFNKIFLNQLVLDGIEVL